MKNSINYSVKNYTTKNYPVKYSIVLPCKNEEYTIGLCIKKARSVLPNSEIIVVDNNSTDKSAFIAKNAGAIVIPEKIQGYGAALRRGFKEAKGEYVIMCDSDDTYDLLELTTFTKFTENKKNKSYDIIIGNRFNKNMKKGSMKFMHRYVGNPLLSGLMRILFNTQVRDSHCGFRMINKTSLDKLQLESDGMELASEMIIKASQQKMHIKEVDITYYPRNGLSKLKSFNDGWKHLKMMLLYSPNYLFLIPGISLFVLGIFLMIILMFQSITIFGITFVTHPVIIGSLMTIMGFNIMQLWIYAKTYKMTIFDESDKLILKIHKQINLEKSMLFGFVLVLIGIILGVSIIFKWIHTNFGRLNDFEKSVFALTIIVLGIQTIFSGFMLSILGTKRNSEL